MQAYTGTSCCVLGLPPALADDLVDVVQVRRGGAPGAAEHAVDLALVQQHRADQGQPAAHLDLGHLRRDALALGHAVVGLPEVAVARVFSTLTTS
jgi:hypothetical protein